MGEFVVIGSTGYLGLGAWFAPDVAALLREHPIVTLTDGAGQPVALIDARTGQPVDLCKLLAELSGAYNTGAEWSIGYRQAASLRSALRCAEGQRRPRKRVRNHHGVLPKLRRGRR